MACILLSSAPAEAATARERGLSWGKAGISFDEYRRDAMDCGIKGATANIRDRKDTIDVLNGTRNQDRAIDLGNARMSMHGEPPHLDIEELKNTTAEYSNIYRRTIRGGVKRTQSFMEDGVTTCLRGHGYAPFQLTKAQLRGLNRFRTGTQERRQYLYRLASDPAILSAQNIDSSPAEK